MNTDEAGTPEVIRLIMGLPQVLSLKLTANHLPMPLLVISHINASGTLIDVSTAVQQDEMIPLATYANALMQRRNWTMKACYAVVGWHCFHKRYYDMVFGEIIEQSGRKNNEAQRSNGANSAA